MNFEQVLKLITASLQLGFFLLTCAGLVISTGLLMLGHITSDNWMTVSLVLFAADRASHAVSNIKGLKSD